MAHPHQCILIFNHYGKIIGAVLGIIIVIAIIFFMALSFYCCLVR